MRRVIIGLATSGVSEDRQKVPSNLDGSYPAIDVEERTYLDGESVHFGTAAGRIDTQETDVHIDERGIHTERVEGREVNVTDFICDPAAGWVGVDSSNGDWLFETLMGVWNANILRCKLDVTAFAKHVDDQDGNCWQIGYKHDLDDDDDDGQAKSGTMFHRDAHFGAGSGQYTQFGYSYLFDDQFVRGTVAQSGYVAEFNADNPEFFARWLKEEILPFCSVDEPPQTTISEVRR
ncbi:hypothetical protein DEQ92_20445 [Haloferax sp. Atlit-6N]|uniref:hypothetical protein n=1 Tax=Haloferax sp. Atlit-6N TaxID=2077205 RepID=UPI000E240D3D|nr:hypothetical protein [Haloferax sp. Atlit-6N]REA00223.1 hypothetical protein DEQ92_20445 [Haloferax sp. Atlit-6N]